MLDSGYVTTNIRVSKETYLRLKQEAAEKRKSFSAVVREKIGDLDNEASKKKLSELLKRTRGMLAGQDFYADEEGMKRLELEAAKKAKEEW